MTVVVPASAPGAIARAADVLRRGGLVAFPTETVYGLGANALDEAAVRRVFAAKGRPSFNPIIVHVADVAAARMLAQEWPATAEQLATAFWPGPLTLVVPKRAAIPDIVTAGRPAVGLRVPAHPVALALLQAAAVPVAAPSANRSTAVSPTTAEHVRRGLDGQVDLVLDGGPTSAGIESTVVDLTSEPATLLRPGPVSLDALMRVIGPVARARPTGAADTPRPSPGLLARHYAPRAHLSLAVSPADAAARVAAWRAGGPTGAILRVFPDLPVDHLVRLPADPAGYARGLYAALHTMDELRCASVVVEAVPEEAAWDGVRDRLTRAATRR